MTDGGPGREGRYGRVFARYSELIPDFDGFLASVARPTPTHVRVNTLRAEPGKVAAALAAQGVAVRPEPWCSYLLRVEGEPPRALGATLLHALGLIYLQSASSAVAALALGARPGEAALDLCAAPGSKTTLLAQTMGDQGVVLANEPNPRRLQSLVANLDRLGITSAVVTGYSGQNFPLERRFQRVLVDAPCSGEGTWRGPRARPQPPSDSLRRHLARQQGALLRRGYVLLAPGGTLVYSTCTYAPEENEEVVGSFLAETGARVESLDLDLPAAPGLTAWEGESFPPELALAQRLYPHRFDSEGFFVVRLVKP